MDTSEAKLGRYFSLLLVYLMKQDCYLCSIEAFAIGVVCFHLTNLV